MITSFKAFLAESEEDSSFSTRQFRVPVENLPKLEEKIKELNKKAAKLGTKPNIIHYGESVLELVTKAKGFPGQPGYQPPVHRRYQYLTVEGEIPVLAGGWSFIGKLEPHPAGTIVKSIPGNKIPKKYNNADACKCEHCNTKKKRKETFVVKKGKTTKQVGRSCLKDFLGHASPEQYASYAEVLASMEDNLSALEGDHLEYGPRYEPEYNNLDVISTALAAIKRDGFKSKAYSDYPTSSVVFKHFNPPMGKEAEYHVPLNVTKEDYQTAEKVVDYIKNKNDTSEFWTNLKKLVSTSHNYAKYFGYFAAAANFYKKEVEQVEAKKKLSDGVSNEPIAKIGDKVKFEAEVISAFKYQGQSFSYYDSGVRQVLTMKDAQGRLIKMFSSNLDITKGDKVIISGRIGSWEDEKYEKSPFKGMKMTSMAPKSRITLVPASKADTNSGDPFDGIEFIEGKPVPSTIESIKVNYDKSNQWQTSVTIKTKAGDSFTKTFKPSAIKFK